ncbi:MAG: 50S ribosomal protein L21 [Nitrospirae bacterium]|nr:MAG: 50S ribosomal protein L21 [Nitrospirota bacterium]
MYAIIETGGKQYRVEPGMLLQVEKLDVPAGQRVELRPVRFLSTDSGSMVGTPSIEHACVTAKVIRTGRTRSITIFKKKRRKNYRRTRGHRQYFTQLRVEEILTTQ